MYTLHYTILCAAILRHYPNAQCLESNTAETLCSIEISIIIKSEDGTTVEEIGVG